MNLLFSSEFRWLLIFVILALGCNFEPVAVKPRPKSIDDVMGAEQDDLTQGLDQLFRVNDPDPLRAQKLGLYHLNQWLLRHDAVGDWKRDPLLQRIPPALAKVQQVEELDRKRFTAADFQYLQYRIVQRDLARWVTAATQPLEEPLASWFKQLEASQPKEQVGQLAAATQIFDWIVRNIQLDALPTPENPTNKTETSELLAQRGDDGPGYRRSIGETLQFGHGDAYERMRVFAALCRQLEIDTVVLGIHPEKQAFQPWVVGVLIGDQLYLFDPELGLPLPAANDSGIVTLAELVKEPALLRQLDLDDKRPYTITAEHLATLEVRMDLAPEELSLRMAKLQPTLLGEQAVKIAYDTTAVLERLKRVPQISPVVALWNVPLLECLYRDFGRNIRLRKDREFALEYDRETIAFQPGSVPWIARQLHLQGIFEEQEVHAGAVQLYLHSRPTEFSIDDIRMSPEFRQKVGMEMKLSDNEEQRKLQLEFFAARAQRLRESMSIWLGLIQYENRDFNHAVDWFQARSLEISPNNYWTRSARYNLARTFERLGKTEEAIKLYRIDASPQRHGNLIRARRLAAMR